MWTTLIGRIGTVFLTIGLALALVSLIPPATGYTTLQTGWISSEKYQIMHSQVYTPQTGLQITVGSNCTVKLYILGVSAFELINWTLNWVNETYPNLEDYRIWDSIQNLTVLELFLQAHPPDIILWESPLEQNITRSYFPPTVLNVTLIVANPTLNMAEVEVKTAPMTAFAPNERVALPALFLISTGTVLAIPWIISKVKRTP
ncbi:MAG: hypothetical protein QXK98_04220 [Candidatus Bathyarchaeia archaeon]